MDGVVIFTPRTAKREGKSPEATRERAAGILTERTVLLCPESLIDRVKADVQHRPSLDAIGLVRGAGVVA